MNFLLKKDNEIESNQQAAILIDETIMDNDDNDDEPDQNRTKSNVQSPLESIEIDHESNSVKSANVCNETLDMAVLDEEEIENSQPQPQQTQVEKTPQIISKKRKSIDIIELSDDDDNDDDDLIASKQHLDLIVEEERPKKLKSSDDVIELDSPVLVNSDRVGRFLNSQEEKKLASDDDEEHLNEQQLLSLLNKTTPNVTAAHKSLVRSPFASQCLGKYYLSLIHI